MKAKANSAAPEEIVWRKKSNLGEVWHRLKKNKIAVGCLFIIAAVFIIAVFAKQIAPYPYDLQDYTNVYGKPSAEHWLGTDGLGRDILSRLIYGASVCDSLSGWCRLSF